MFFLSYFSQHQILRASENRLVRWERERLKCLCGNLSGCNSDAHLQIHSIVLNLKTQMSTVWPGSGSSKHTNLLHPFTSSPLMNILIVPPQKESVASFLRGHQHWAVQAFCINNKFIMHECGPLLRIDKWMWIRKCSILACKWTGRGGWNDTRSVKVQMCTPHF